MSSLGGLGPWRDKKCGKKAWTRSTVVSERGRPETISHLPLLSFGLSPASGFRCNHYVTHHSLADVPLLSRSHRVLSLSPSSPPALYSTPPLSRRAADRSSCEGWFDYSCTTLTILFSSRFSFYRLSSFLTETAHRSLPHAGHRSLLARQVLSSRRVYLLYNAG